MKNRVLFALSLCLALAMTPCAFAVPVACDVDLSGAVDALDVQSVINVALGLAAAEQADVDLSGATDALDVQLVVNTALGIDVDADDDGLADAAEANLGTSPDDFDSDDDGVGDGQEVLDGTNPVGPDPSTSDVVISEFLAANDSSIQDEDGDTPDWIELHNRSDAAVSVGGWVLTDDAANHEKWVFPAIEMPANSYLVVFASGKDRRPIDGTPLHANFKLSASGEYLALLDNGTPRGVASEFSPMFPEQVADISYGLYEGAGLRYFGAPSPGVANPTEGAIYKGFAAAPALSHEHGFFDSAFSLTLSTDAPDATIRYTLDGTEPTGLNGLTYQAWAEVPVSANTVVRARAYAPEYLPSIVTTQTYLFEVPVEQRSLPTFSIVANPEQSLYEPNGVMAIVGGTYVPGGPFYVDGYEFQTDPVWQAVAPEDYNNPIQRGELFERSTSFELLQPTGEPGFQIDCGIRVQGSSFHRSRYRRDPGADWTLPGQSGLGTYIVDYNKFSFRMYFRDDYGFPTLDYPLFERGEVQSFERLVLRGGHNDGYNPFIHDELTRRLMGDAGHVTSRGIIATLFINGEYKGYYNVVERLDQEFFQSHYESEEDWDVIASSEVREGDGLAWNELVNYVRTHDMSVEANYQEAASRMDMRNFIDYLLVQLYAANEDWPDNNWTVAKERVPGAKFRFYIWDAEAGFRPGNLYKTGLNSFPYGRPRETYGLNGENTALAYLYRALKASGHFRVYFSTRAHYQFGPDGALNEANVRARYEELRDEMLKVRPDLITYIGDTWIPNRQAVMIAALTADGVYF